MNHNIQNKIKNIIITLVISTIVSFSSLSVAHAAASTDSLVTSVNNSRAQEGLGVLTTNTQLESAALLKAQDMFQNQYFAHVSPTGKTPWDFIKTANYTYVYAGENLAIGYTDSTELHNAWMNSPTHRENIMNPNFREIGMASVDGVYDGAHTTIVVQMFGSTIATVPVTDQKVAGSSENKVIVKEIPIVVSNAAPAADSSFKLSTVATATINVLKDNLLTASLITIILTLMLSGYFLFRHKHYGKLI